MIAEQVASPCIGRCALDEDEVCVGCFRHVTEIAGWGLSDAEARRTILARCAQRRQDAATLTPLEP